MYGENNKLAVQLNYKDGLIKSYSYEDKTGKLSAPVLLVKGSGKITAYYPNGNQSAEIDVVDGNINGARKIFFSTGKVYIDGTRRDDYDEGVKKVYYPDGTLHTEQTFVNGSLHGVSKTFYPSGKIQLEQKYYNGDLHGTTQYFDEQGKPKQTRTYYYNTLLTAK
jgi:antitoxin component YwqK of YwqJK toxin-antitoxin module